MVRKAFKSLIFALVYLLGLVGGLAWRAVQVFVGTYQSATWEVRRAGAVADLNAAVLAAATILLWTSRTAFSEAQNNTSRYAWLSQLSEKPVVACNTFNQEPFEGNLYHDLYFLCKPPLGSSLDSTKSALKINLDPKKDVEQVLIPNVYNGCDAFSMALRVQRLSNITRLCRHTGNESIASALKGIADLLDSSAFKSRVTQVTNSHTQDPYYLDEIRPAANACATHLSAGSGEGGPDSVQGAGQRGDLWGGSLATRGH